eukprot:scaffold11474_cov114-Isochrysis_galbana.AAC.1
MESVLFLNCKPGASLALGLALDFRPRDRQPWHLVEHPSACFVFVYVRAHTCTHVLALGGLCALATGFGGKLSKYVVVVVVVGMGADE